MSEDESDAQSSTFDEYLEDIDGLTRNAEGQLEFRLPLGSREAKAGIDFVLATISSLVKLEKIGSTIVFVGSKAAVGYTAGLLVEQLWDTALADMLGTLGGVDYETAVRELLYARDAPTEEERDAHRDTAKKFLVGAYNKYDYATRENAQGAAALHGEAASAALVVAFIEHDKGFLSATERANDAKKHFEQYRDRTIETARATLSHIEAAPRDMTRAGIHGGRTLKEKGVRAAFGFAAGGVYYLARVSRARARLVATVARFERSQKQFDRLYVRLVPPEGTAQEP